MPDPLSRDEFQAVIDRAVKTAPAGLSPEEFDDYVHTAALRDEAAKAASVPPAAASVKMTPTGVVSGFLSSLGGMAKGAVNTVLHPIDTATGLVDAQLAEPKKAYKAFSEGRLSEGAGHTAAALLPILGPAAANIGERIATTGDVGEGIGEGAGLVATTPSIAGPAVRGLGRGAQAVAEAVRIPSRYAGAGAILHGNPVVGAGILAAPSVARAVGRGAEAAGNAYEALGAVPGRAMDSLRALFEPGPIVGEAPDVASAWRRHLTNPRVSSEVPGFSMPEEPATATQPIRVNGMTPLEYVRSLKNAGKLATTGPEGWTGPTGSGAPSMSVMDGEIVPETGPRGLPAAPAADAIASAPARGALPGARQIQLGAGRTARAAGPASIEALMNWIDDRLGQHESARLGDEQNIRRNPQTGETWAGDSPSSGIAAQRFEPSEGDLGPEFQTATSAPRVEPNRTPRDLPNLPTEGALFRKLIDLGYTPAEIAARIAKSRTSSLSSLGIKE